MNFNLKIHMIIVRRWNRIIIDSSIYNDKNQNRLSMARTIAQRNNIILLLSSKTKIYNLYLKFWKHRKSKIKNNILKMTQKSTWYTGNKINRRCRCSWAKSADWSPQKQQKPPSHRKISILTAKTVSRLHYRNPCIIWRNPSQKMKPKICLNRTQ